MYGKGVVYRILCCILCQTFSMGDRSGLQTGQSNFCTLLLWSHAVVTECVFIILLESADVPDKDVVWMVAYRISGLHALSVHSDCCRFFLDGLSGVLHPNPAFLPKVISDFHLLLSVDLQSLFSSGGDQEFEQWQFILCLSQILAVASCGALSVLLGSVLLT